MPHPFVMRAPREEKGTYDAGEAIGGELVLIGRAGYYVRRVTDALELMGKLGLGQERGRCILEEVRPVGRFEMEPAAVRSDGSGRWKGLHALRRGMSGEGSGSDVRLNFLTPLRLKYTGKFVSNVEFHHIVRNLLRRVSAMAQFHCSLDAGSFNFGNCISQAKGVRAVHRDVRWKDWPTCSRKHTEKVFLGGITGAVTFSEVPPEYLSLLEVGEELHVGKAASFGLGRYELEVNRTASPEYGQTYPRFRERRPGAVSINAFSVGSTFV
ncbi:MAG: CRISPR system precrRNA processing endoribonuclease RAMP protein Cas6 [Deltaproteobacteria bacterium]|nr:CRISPR system precrRNA processing endoribonuclease RAMP protein Cas6 [Deltaproteobacteria bacterium]